MMVNHIKRPANFVSAGFSYLRSHVFSDAVIRSMPVTVSVEITYHCNLRCPECFSGSGRMTRSRGYMDISLFEKIAGELKPYLYEMSIYFQGESMLHPDFHSFLEKSRGISTTLATNGHFLSPGNAEMLSLSGLNKIIVSLDGMDQDIYSEYRINGDVKEVLSGIRNVSEAIRKNSSGLKLVIQFLVNRLNEHQIPAARHFVKEVNASVRFKSMQIINENAFEKWLPAEKRFRRYELKGNRYSILSRLPDNCARMWFNPVITWDGKVIPCCFDKDAEHVLGDMNKESFREIWTGKRYRLFRKGILSGRKMTGICRNCTSGLYWKIIS